MKLRTHLIITIATLIGGCSTTDLQQRPAITGAQTQAVIEAPVMAEAMPVAPAMVIVPPPSPRVAPAAGVVTAGDIDDTLNLSAFLRYQGEASSELRLPKANFNRPVLAQLRGSDGAPAPGVRITLHEPGAADPFYDGYSGVDGNVTVFPATLGQSRLRTVEMRAFPDTGGPAVVTTLQTGQTQHAVTLPFTGTWSPDFLDLVFVVDTTGSMADELSWLAQEIREITRNAQSAAPGVDIRFGLVVYKAPADPYVIKSYGFTRNLTQFRQWVASERSSGGAGGPEVVADALQAAMQLDWRRGRGERLLFQVGDEPPRASQTRTYYDAARTAAANGIQIFGLAASGVEDRLEFLMRQGSVVTGGRYLFLTDDSGVGFSHAEPTVSCYQVTRLNDLMVRVLRSELTGRRVEAAPSDVIREVGSYDNGRCRN
ncbi:vWA domain-containing protein [Loktanella sp. Alg231-35]|uniref:vWA domain-containing protein n=1 Tax=Loktanella sp. Alg231-35 TaxID=1922220 RepID=UPI00131EE60A|nr:vWA domain-containing protein [Loktanella sp. Alg231-35]